NKRLADKELVIRLKDAALTYVIDHGYELAYGARPVKRYLTNHVDKLTARMILSGYVYQPDTNTAAYTHLTLPTNTGV
ncbi:hypothetical protein JYQ77_10875, partial [Anaerobutyricum soehngenii]|uniref:hypothetical protein n=1 Tax=Anaerobutyricum soehngenii TaxID=105843 RepID=UPI001ADDBBA5